MVTDFLVEQVVRTRERGQEHTLAQVVAVAKICFQFGKAIRVRFARGSIILIEAAAKQDPCIPITVFKFGFTP